MRLIDADALRNKLQEEIDKAIPPFDDVIGSIRCGVRLARNIVEDEPTIDAEPVRHGKWIIRDNPGTGWYRITCSECGEDVTSTAPCIGFFPNAKVVWDYCPYCGARMDEERKEE